ncbi:MAG: DegV family protein, partial [Acidimicrobiales bacterium]
MSGVRIVTDSACDLTDDELAEHGIEMVPLSIRFGDDEFVDRIELSIDEFYRRLAQADVLPETAAPAPGLFAAAFQKLLDDGADAIVCINLSAALSATMQAAETAVTGLDGSP